MSKTIKIRKKSSHVAIVARPTQSVKVKIKGAGRGAKENVEILVGNDTFDVQVGNNPIQSYALNPVDDSRILDTRGLILAILEDWTGVDDITVEARLSELDTKPKKLVSAIIDYLEHKDGSEFGIPVDVVKDVAKESVESLISLIENLDGIRDTWEYNPDQDHFDLVRADVTDIFRKVTGTELSPIDSDQVSAWLDPAEMKKLIKKVNKSYDMFIEDLNGVTFGQLCEMVNTQVIEDEVEDSDTDD